LLRRAPLDFASASAGLKVPILVVWGAWRGVDGLSVVEVGDELLRGHLAIGVLKDRRYLTPINLVLI
jgi:hypothetical protein